MDTQDRRAVHTMVVTAIPLGISWILTYGEVRKNEISYLLDNSLFF